MVARDAVHASLHGIDQQPSPQTCLPHQSGEILLRRERSLRLFVGNEFNAAQQAQSANIAHRIQIAQTFQSFLQSRSRGSFRTRFGSLGIGGMHQVQCPDAPQHRSSGRHRNRVCVVGKAVQKSSRALGDRINHFLARNHRPQRRVSRRQALGRNQNVGRDLPVLNREITSSSPHAGHDFIGNQQHTVALANFGDGP